MDEFRELPVRASRKKDLIQQGVFDSGALDLLQSYGAKRSWIWVMWHCECHLCDPNTLPPLLNIDRRVALPRFGCHFPCHPGASLHLARRVQLCENNSYIRDDIFAAAFIAPYSASECCRPEQLIHAVQPFTYPCVLLAPLHNRFQRHLPLDHFTRNRPGAPNMIRSSIPIECSRAHSYIYRRYQDECCTYNDFDFGCQIISLRNVLRDTQC
jgi:hypothetical protein